MRLKDKVAIITGAGSGIGAATAAATAVAMAAEGARVLVADVNEAGAKATVQKIEAARGQALAMTADVTRARCEHFRHQESHVLRGFLSPLFERLADDPACR